MALAVRVVVAVVERVVVAEDVGVVVPVTVGVVVAVEERVVVAVLLRLVVFNKSRPKIWFLPSEGQILNSRYKYVASLSPCRL